MAKETQAKYHHLIPQTYMSAWSRRNGTLKVEFKDDPGVVVERNKERIAGITDFHSIKAGMPICTQSDADLIFAAISSYTVTYEDRALRKAGHTGLQEDGEGTSVRFIGTGLPTFSPWMVGAVPSCSGKLAGFCANRS